MSSMLRSSVLVSTGTTRPVSVVTATPIPIWPDGMICPFSQRALSRGCWRSAFATATITRSVYVIDGTCGCSCPRRATSRAAETSRAR